MVLRLIGTVFLLGVIPLILLAIQSLGGRDYVGGGILVMASAAVGHLGLEVLALAVRPGPVEPGDGA